MSYKIQVYEPYVADNQKKYILDCIDTNWISSKGKYISEFETQFSNFIKIKNSIAVSNGTTALHTALVALDIKQGDEVIVPTFTYIASVNSIAYTGATPVFVDIDEETWQMNIEEIEEKITKKTKAIMAVHLYGHPVEMNKVLEIAKKYNLKIIEDCAEAIGSYYENNHVGTFGDISCFSFFGNKTITCGEGGMVCTNDDEIAKKIKKIKGQGLAEDKEYWHDLVGYNYRMTNIQAAIGLSQLEKINTILEKKQNILNTYKKYLNTKYISTQKLNSNCKNGNWMISILTKNNKDRDPLRSFLLEKNIETRPFFYPIHTMKMYKSLKTFPVSTMISLRGINLPSSPNLTEEQVTYICKNINEFYEK